VAEAAPVIDGDFPVARCVPCAREVLTHLRIDDDGRERRCCVHCDAELDPDEVRWVGTSELDAAGYALLADPADGCGRPDCGQGRCGNRR
jgi:hypothetical protein